MKHSTAYNHQRRLMRAMASVYASAVYSRPTHRDLTATVVQRVWEDPALKRCPSWVHHGLLVYREMLSELLWSNLRWGFEGSDGIIRPSFLDLSAEDQQAVREDRLKGAHYWLITERQPVEASPSSTVAEAIVRKYTNAKF